MDVIPRSNGINSKTQNAIANEWATYNLNRERQFEKEKDVESITDFDRR